ncbi:putative uncharacterized protein [Clostridium sp. CAG:1024]|mgnify:FL=1|jgi:glucokinase|nr:putative uncharacterized protein [Clostridium sp. CAG:1024]
MNALSIDSGGTKVIGAVVTQEGDILSKVRYNIPQRDGDCLVEIYTDIFNQFRSKFQIDVVGIGANGRIDPVRGIILDCGVHANWDGRHLGEELRADWGEIPICIHNDCHCAIKGELWQGAAREFDVVAGIIIGTGLGGAIVDHGRFWYGSRYGAGEIGHTILHPQGFPCSCGQKGCAERYVSGTALWQNYNLQLGKECLSSGYQFFDRYRAGDPIALNVMNDFIDGLKLLMINISNLCAPEAILIGGGIADTRDVWGKTLAERYRNEVCAYMKNTRIVYASAGNDAAVFGAAKFAFELLEATERGNVS